MSIDDENRCEFCNNNCSSCDDIRVSILKARILELEQMLDDKETERDRFLMEYREYRCDM